MKRKTYDAYCTDGTVALRNLATQSGIPFSDIIDMALNDDLGRAFRQAHERRALGRRMQIITRTMAIREPGSTLKTSG
jgi:hypothetical protein